MKAAKQASPTFSRGGACDRAELISGLAGVVVATGSEIWESQAKNREIIEFALFERFCQRKRLQLPGLRE